MYFLRKSEKKCIKRLPEVRNVASNVMISAYFMENATTMACAKTDSKLLYSANPNKRKYNGDFSMHTPVFFLKNLV